MSKRIAGPTEMQDSFKYYFGRSAHPPFNNLDDLLRAPDFVKVHPYGQNRLRRTSDPNKHYASLIAQDELMTNVMKIMADNKLDAIVCLRTGNASSKTAANRTLIVSRFGNDNGFSARIGRLIQPLNATFTCVNCRTVGLS